MNNTATIELRAVGPQENYNKWIEQIKVIDGLIRYYKTLDENITFLLPVDQTYPCPTRNNLIQDIRSIFEKSNVSVDSFIYSLWNKSLAPYFNKYKISK